MKTNIVNMMLTRWAGVCLSFLVISLPTGQCGSSGSEVKAACTCPPAVEGQASKIELNFHGIDFSTDQFFMVLRKNGTDIVRCGDLGSSRNCTVLNKSFKLDGPTAQNMTLVIPVAKQNMEGLYVLRVHVNTSKVKPTSCELMVASDTTMGTHNSTATPVTAAVVEDRPEVVTVVVPVLVMMVVINIIIIVVLFRHRGSVRNCVGRKRHHDYVATDETDTMTDSEHRTESS